jgi:signal peptidase II
VKRLTAGKLSILIIVLVLLFDQILKFWIKLNMFLGQEFHILGKWFIIHFTENNGMAFGWQFAGEHGKLFLTLIRIIAVTFIAIYLIKIIRKDAHKGYVAAISLILVGALGNIIDSAFYGMIFSESGNFIDQYPAILFPSEGGYSSFLHGKVVDMLYFPIIQGYYPTWFPFNAGQEFIFFRPVFNISDASITTGVAILLIFQKHFFTEHPKPSITDDEEQEEIIKFD